jgi:hypothetical protein
LQWLALVWVGVMLVACSGGGSGSADVERRSDTPSSNDPSDTPDPGDSTSTPVLLDGNIFFPAIDGVSWHYDNNDVVTFEGDLQVKGRAVMAMLHSLPGMAEEEYIQIDGSAIKYGGLFDFLVSVPGFGDVNARIEFDSLRTIYDVANLLGETANFKGGDAIVEPSLATERIRYDWSSSVQSVSLRSAGQFGDVPSVEVVVEIKIFAALDDFFLVPVEVADFSTTLWLSPGLGIVARQFGTSVITLDTIDGIQKPVVFVFDQGSGLAQAAQQIMIDGSAITDIDRTVVIAYGTTEVDWLAVEFDGTGSWQASIIGQELPQGIHGAVIQITQNGIRTDIPVSVLVE